MLEKGDIIKGWECTFRKASWMTALIQWIRFRWMEEGEEIPDEDVKII